MVLGVSTLQSKATSAEMMFIQRIEIGLTIDMKAGVIFATFNPTVNVFCTQWSTSPDMTGINNSFI